MSSRLTVRVHNEEVLPGIEYPLYRDFLRYGVLAFAVKEEAPRELIVGNDLASQKSRVVVQTDQRPGDILALLVCWVNAWQGEEQVVRRGVCWVK